MLHIEIDGRKLEVKEGSMIIEAADAAGIYIPRFCYHRKLSVAANCRMCLVDVEKIPKPLPACATPVTDGMIVRTHSAKAVAAQKGVMEFLLINHPLDCPICDQGGECDLQDLSVGYGSDVSRFTEKKRIVMDKYIGPLIATEMTRCIHCTRCIRFGQEIGGIKEMGATGRGEHMRVGTYVEQSIDSELSGNMIDLCPVGALTSRPFRFTARSWELQSRPSVSPHDCIGSNIRVEIRHNKVMRVLPRDNEEINEIWLSDRDRFSYTALNSQERLVKPMIRQHGSLVETDWATALEFTAAGLRRVLDSHGAPGLGALASPTSTLEEFYLLQKLVRALGSANIDHRLHARDFSDDGGQPPFPWLGQTIQELESLDAVLLIGSNVRKEQPLIGHRLRKAFLAGARIAAVNPMDHEFTFDLHAKVVAAPDEMLRALARIAQVLADAAGQPLRQPVPAWTAGTAAVAQEQEIARILLSGKRTAVLLGDFASGHERAADLRALAELIAELSSARLGRLAEANSAGGWLAGCLPHRGPGAGATAAGLNAYEMLAQPRQGYLILGAEPELDCWDGALARRALGAAEFVTVLSVFKDVAQDYAHVLLPLAPFTETSGTFVNCEGRWQSFAAAVSPAGETRPGWKILRVLGNVLGREGFDYTSSEQIRDEAARHAVTPSARLRSWTLGAPPGVHAGLVRVAEVPLYAVDPVVRRAAPLQQTRDAGRPLARINATEAQRCGVAGATAVRVVVGAGEVALGLEIDGRVPDGCIWIPGGYAETAPLAGQGPVSVAGVDL
ncbi:MAG: NADH-quinone oxidoreductase subunit NuoG [Gammaproteobacteria bacterium]|nr:NADH-quinone oxidoreductase subunit NuoG [Gammaproteobacteria bacterium]